MGQQEVPYYHIGSRNVGFIAEYFSYFGETRATLVEDGEVQREICPLFASGHECTRSGGEPQWPPRQHEGLHQTTAKQQGHSAPGVNEDSGSPTGPWSNPRNFHEEFLGLG